MGYTFSKQPKKIPYKGLGTVQKSAAGEAVLRKLRSFLDSREPQLVRFLVRQWNLQEHAITYKELREALLSGDIDQAYLDQWHQDYTKFVTEHMLPAWQEAMDAAAKEITAKYPEFSFDPMADGVRQWTENRAADFVTNVTQTQIEGLRAVVQKAAVLEDMTVDQLSRVIRPMVGLTKQQAEANLRYYKTLIDSGTGPKRAKDLSIRYAARQQRYRGYLVARTELAYAYNKGAHEGIKQAQAAGYMGEVVKVWSTAEDERTCPVCKALEGKTIAMDDDFDFYTKLEADNPGIRRTPPAHPSCRCAVEYREIAPPTF